MKEVLLVSIGFSPNVGGIETHFDNLVAALDRRGYRIWVLTYKPITTKVSAPVYENRGNKVIIYRIPTLRGFFYKLVKTPFLEFIYLAPGLFIVLPIFLIFKGKEIKTIHSHGLIAGFASVFWAKVFGKKVITTTHSIYHFPPKGLYTKFAKWIFANSDQVLVLSHQSKREIERLGIEKRKINVFTYWLNLNQFKKISNAKKKLGWRKKFVALFVGRLVPEKGVRQLLQVAKSWDKNLTLVVIGTGPLEKEILNSKSEIRNLIYLGKIDNEKLPLYYSAADLVIVPSTHEEGFGRVILESLSCGTPVVGSRRGAIPEAMDETVGKLIDVSPENIKKAIEFFYKNPDKLEELSKKARKFAEERYSERNVEKIIGVYKF